MMDFEPEVYNAGRGFKDAQTWLAAQGMGIESTFADAECGWHDAAVDGHRGSFALVQIGSRLEDLVGDRIRVVSHTGRSVLAYVYGSASVPLELSLAFSPWVRLTYPSVASLSVRVEVLR